MPWLMNCGHFEIERCGCHCGRKASMEMDDPRLRERFLQIAEKRKFPPFDGKFSTLDARIFSPSKQNPEYFREDVLRAVEKPHEILWGLHNWTLYEGPKVHITRGPAYSVTEMGVWNLVWLWIPHEKGFCRYTLYGRAGGTPYWKSFVGDPEIVEGPPKDFDNEEYLARVPSARLEIDLALASYKLLLIS